MGADHPKVSLASTLVDLQGQIGSLMANLTTEYANFVKFITTEPSFFTQMRSDASLLNRQIVATVAAVSPSFANPNVFKLGAPIFFQNQPNTITASQTLVSTSEQLFNVAPCLIALSQIGVQVNPILIQVSPRVLQLDAVGVQVQPEVITVDPTLINIGPNGVNASPTNVKASPTFIDVSPTVKIVPNSNKAPTVAAGIAIKPNPDAPTITNEWGKVVATAPTPKLTPVNADGSPIKAAAAKAPATGRRL
ncbi:g8699 [Coccomyxa elongata]